MKKDEKVKITIGKKEIKNGFLKTLVSIIIFSVICLTLFLSVHIMLYVNLFGGIILLLLTGTWITLRDHNNETMTYVFLTELWKKVKYGF